MSICNCEFGCNDNLNVIEFLNVDVYVGVFVHEYACECGSVTDYDVNLDFDVSVNIEEVRM